MLSLPYSTCCWPPSPEVLAAAAAAATWLALTWLATGLHSAKGPLAMAAAPLSSSSSSSSAHGWRGGGTARN